MFGLSLDLVRPLAIFTGYMIFVAIGSSKLIRPFYRGMNECMRKLPAESFSAVPLYHLRRGRGFIILAAVSLSVTWYFMFKFFVHSYTDWLDAKISESLQSALRSDVLDWTLLKRIGAWLKDTSLFEQAWASAMADDAKYWWTQQIFFITTAFSVLLYTQGSQMDLPKVWIFMFVGQVVAISFAMNLLFASMALSQAVDALATEPTDTKSEKEDDTTVSRDERSNLNTGVVFSTLQAVLSILALPGYLGTKAFLYTLAAIHISLFVPPFVAEKSKSRPSSSYHGFETFPKGLYLLIGLTALFSQVRVMIAVSDVNEIISAFVSHPAVSSVGSDVALCWISAFIYMVF